MNRPMLPKNPGFFFGAVGLAPAGAGEAASAEGAGSTAGAAGVLAASVAEYTRGSFNCCGLAGAVGPGRIAAAGFSSGARPALCARGKSLLPARCSGGQPQGSFSWSTTSLKLPCWNITLWPGCTRYAPPSNTLDTSTYGASTPGLSTHVSPCCPSRTLTSTAPG